MNARQIALNAIEAEARKEAQAAMQAFKKSQLAKLFVIAK